ncbi:MAG: hypothetical protein WKF76_13220 [Nocardioidaceae bacterium]
MKDPKRDVERIRAALARVAPSDPGVDARAARVAARARRQRARRGTAGVIAVAAGAAVLVIAPQVFTSMRTENVGTIPSAGQPTSTNEQAFNPFATTPCPATPYDLGTAAADQQTTDEIRGDAQAVRLCAATVDAGTAEPWLPPRDALELTLDDGFLMSVRRLTEADPDRCAAIRAAPDPYTLVVSYADGSVETVAVTTQCSDVTVDGRRIASGDVLAAFQDALGQQRQSLQPARLNAPGVDCLGKVGGPGPLVPVTRGVRIDGDTRFAGFVTCVGDGPDQSEAAAVQLLNDEWPTSIRDLSTQDPLDVDRCPSADVDAASSYGVTSWGDVLEFSFRRCGNYLVRGYAPADASNAFGPAAVQFLPSEKLSDALHLF